MLVMEMAGRGPCTSSWSGRSEPLGWRALGLGAEPVHPEVCSTLISPAVDTLAPAATLMPWTGLRFESQRATRLL